MYFVSVGDICGVNSSPVIKYNGPQAKIYNFLDFMGMVENITFPLHRHLGAYEFRLKTYENLKTKIRFGAEALCEAGFLYAGILPFFFYQFFKYLENILIV